jgi:hypothetical protein
MKRVSHYQVFEIAEESIFFASFEVDQNEKDNGPKQIRPEDTI